MSSNLERNAALLTHPLFQKCLDDHAKKDAEIERLQAIEKAAKRWSIPTGIHRSCDCRLCMALWKAVEEEGE